MYYLQVHYSCSLPKGKPEKWFSLHALCALRLENELLITFLIIIISITQKGSKGDSLNSMVRLEFGANLLGESPKVEANTETHSTEYNFNASFDCAFEDASSLDSISYKPVIG